MNKTEKKRENLSYRILAFLCVLFGIGTFTNENGEYILKLQFYQTNKKHFNQNRIKKINLKNKTQDGENA